MTAVIHSEPNVAPPGRFSAGVQEARREIDGAGEGDKVLRPARSFWILPHPAVTMR